MISNNFRADVYKNVYLDFVEFVSIYINTLISNGLSSQNIFIIFADESLRIKILIENSKSTSKDG